MLKTLLACVSHVPVQCRYLCPSHCRSHRALLLQAGAPLPATALEAWQQPVPGDLQQRHIDEGLVHFGNKARVRRLVQARFSGRPAHALGKHPPGHHSARAVYGAETCVMVDIAVDIRANLIEAHTYLAPRNCIRTASMDPSLEQCACTRVAVPSLRCKDA